MDAQDPEPGAPATDPSPLAPPFPEIEPNRSPDEAPQTEPIPADDDSGRPHD